MILYTKTSSYMIQCISRRVLLELNVHATAPESDPRWKWPGAASSPSKATFDISTSSGTTTAIDGQNCNLTSVLWFPSARRMRLEGDVQPSKMSARLFPNIRGTVTRGVIATFLRASW
jgi:hypothetical protein